MSDQSKIDPKLTSPASEMPATKEDRVQACMVLMASNAWLRGKTGPELAKDWGCELHLVEHAAAEASRRVKAQDAGWVKGHLCSSLQGALETAQTIEDLRYQVDAIVKVANAWAPIAGATKGGSTEVNVTILNQRYTQFINTVRELELKHFAPGTTVTEATWEAYDAEAETAMKALP